MSKIAVSSPSAGAATYTISAPAGSTDRTINLPDSNGTILTTATAGVPVNGPAFNAYLGASQSIASTTVTKVQLSSELFDTNSCFNPTGSTVGGIPAYAFKPNVAGYYQFSFATYPATPTTTNSARLYKNGAPASWGESNGNSASAGGAVTLYMDGVSDYVELYVLLIGTSPVVFGRQDLTYLSAFLARSAT